MRWPLLLYLLFSPSSRLTGTTGQPSPSPPETAANRTGIARLAASSPLADAKRGAEYFLLPARSILNRCDSERMPFRWTVNPYRGCEFGCRYCYARYTHEYMDLDGADFERKIFVKQDAGPLAARDLLSCAVRGEPIAIGTATDPYQPAEREFGATRAILEEMARLRRIERFDHHQIESGAAGRGVVAANRRAFYIACQSDGDHSPPAPS